jgi:cell division protein FtsW
MSRKKKKSGKPLILVIISLLIFGLVIIYNSTAYFSQSTFGNPFRFVFLQLVWIFIGLIGFLIFANYDYRKLRKVSFFVFLISLGFLILLGVIGLFLCRNPESSGIIFAPCINGASRWLYLNPEPLPDIPFLGVLGFQPSELAKLGIILYLSSQLAGFERKKKSENDPYIVYLVTSLLLSTLLILQPNMSTAILVFAIGTVIYYVSGYSLRPLILSSPVIAVVGFLVMISSDYRRERFFTLIGLRPEANLESGYHIKQVLIALGSGGLFGLGFGQSRQKYQYLPEVASDSIFAIIGEEFGFLGAAAVVLIFSYLIYLGINIAKNASDKLGRMLAAGITSWIALQLFINIAAMTKLIPLTGMPIPLISYGGSSVFFTLLALGVLFNIQKQS